MQDEITGHEAVQAALRANRRLNGFFGLGRDPSRALAIMEPYRNCDQYTWVTPAQNQRIRCIVCAITADCYRELREIETAAVWYRRAGECLKGGIFPAIYADMVLAHGLAEHYATALEQLQDQQASWRSRPWLLRLYYEVVSFWWLHPAVWKLRLRQHTLQTRLKELVEL
jgi:hypothetical protein